MTSIVNTTADAELRFTQTGKPVANVSIAVTDRSKGADGAWVDGATGYYEITVWGGPAESFAETAVKGARLLEAGELTVHEYTDRDGAARTRQRVTAAHAGLSTRFHPARSSKPARQSDQIVTE